jgi:starvation-inducible DNA-binding protein
LREDNRRAVKAMRGVHKLCNENDDVDTASLLEDFIDQSEKRVWFLSLTARKGNPTGH